MSTETVYLLTPEIILVGLATLVYLVGAWIPGRQLWGIVALGSLVASALALAAERHSQFVQDAVFSADATGALSGPLIIDQFSWSVRWAVLAVAFLLVLISMRAAARGAAPEFMGSLLLVIAGLMLIAVSNNLVLMFVGLELISIPTYVVLYLGRWQSNSLEAATKYFFLSVLSSALLLYGFSFLYGATGSLQLLDIRRALSAQVPNAVGLATFARLALILIFAGLGFRITVVPFHFYAPDVYQGTSHSNAGLLAVVPKIAGLVALVRIVSMSMPGVENYAWRLAFAVAVLTMSLGNLLALWQQNIRRLMAYSSIAHAGYMLIGLAVGFAVVMPNVEGLASFDGIGSMFFYLLVYSAATLGTFAALTYLSGQERQLDDVDELNGLARAHPYIAAAIAICMFSLTGLPLMAGFWGKFELFNAALGVDTGRQHVGNAGLWPWFVGLAIAGVINAAVSAGYYLRIVAAMYFRPARARPAAQGGWAAGLATFICAGLVIGIFWYPGWLIEQANQASRSARTSIVQPPTDVGTIGHHSPAGGLETPG